MTKTTLKTLKTLKSRLLPGDHILLTVDEGIADDDALYLTVRSVEQNRIRFSHHPIIRIPRLRNVEIEGDTVRFHRGLEVNGIITDQRGGPVDYEFTLMPRLDEIAFNETFWSPYSQYAERIGQRFTVLRELDDSERDPEVGPMYQIRFDDGTEIEAWPEEVEAEEVARQQQLPGA